MSARSELICAHTGNFHSAFAESGIPAIYWLCYKFSYW